MRHEEKGEERKGELEGWRGRKDSGRGEGREAEEEKILVLSGETMSFSSAGLDEVSSYTVNLVRGKS